jgi:hypothetical protein
MQGKTANNRFDIRLRSLGAGRRRMGLSIIALLLTAFPLWSQTTPQADEPLAFVGMKLADMIHRFGPPRAVYAVRGREEWQDDVVFVYGEGDFYIAKDRVWQIGLTSAFGIAVGDVKQVVSLVLGEAARDEGDYVRMSLSGAGWPLMLRVNFNPFGAVSAIFIYRPDF